MIALLLAASLSAPPTLASPADRNVTAPGPKGPLAGSFRVARRGAPLVLIIPGSGPTDRNGNNPMGVKAAPYRMLAEALSQAGISSIRIDKRGMFGSKDAIADANAVTIADYASDVHTWAAAARKLGGLKCVWVAGHSEGALVALAAAQNPRDLCGVVTLAGAGRPLGSVLREQLQANPANAPLLPVAMRDLDALEKGGSVDEKSVPKPLLPLFRAAVQPYLRDLLSYNPAKLASITKLPLLIVQGGRDLQISVADAQALKTAQPGAQLVIIPEANHVLKALTTPDAAANLASYSRPDLPLAPGIVQAIVSFVKSHKR